MHVSRVGSRDLHTEVIIGRFNAGIAIKARHGDGYLTSLLLAVRIHSLPIRAASTGYVRRCNVILVTTAHQERLYREMLLTVGVLRPEGNSAVITAVGRRNHNKVLHLTGCRERITGMQALVVFIAERGHENATLARERAHALVVERKSVVRTHVSAKTHINHPRLTVGLGEIFNSLGIF